MSDNIYRRAATLVATLGFLWLLAGCSLLDRESTVTVVFPPVPEGWSSGFDRVGCRLEIGSGSGLDLSEWPHRLVWTTALATPVPITATPIADGRFLGPAGGIVYDTAAPVIMTWVEGPVAQVLRSIAGAGLDLRSLNVPRLHSVALSIDRPWDLDKAHLIKSVLSGSIRVTDIRSRPAVATVLELPAGTWFWDTPSRPPVTSFGVPLVLDVPEGFHRLFCCGMTMDLSVSEKETVTLLH